MASTAPSKANKRTAAGPRRWPRCIHPCFAAPQGWPSPLRCSPAGCSPPTSLEPVSYTHLTLPTICSV
eukprot:4341246-Prorocentrum_lima.AAC.1